MQTIYTYTDATDDQLDVDFLPKHQHGEDAFMFSCWSHTQHKGISVIVPIAQAGDMIDVMLRELDALVRDAFGSLRTAEPPPSQE